MDFKVQKREFKANANHRKEDIDLVYNFASRIYKEFGDFLKAVVLFGSTVKKDAKDRKGGDIDILVIVDDASLLVTADVAETYRIIVEKLVVDISPRLHITTLRLTSFWEYIRAGDPIGMNMLREGVPILDSGFFRPLQLLLSQGRIRPTPESIWTYFSKAPATLNNSKWHITQATLDLYWAVIDSAHAALMKMDELPPSPEHVADLIEERLVKPGYVTQRYADIMRTFYKLSKMILHREIKGISGREYEDYYENAYDFVTTMKRVIESRKR
jgi:predicted nucleotidyltransferase